MTTTSPDRDGAERQPVPGGGHRAGGHPHPADRQHGAARHTHQAQAHPTPLLIHPHALPSLIPLLPGRIPPF